MKKVKLLSTLLLLAGILLSMTACRPAAYSRQKRNEVTNAHKADGIAWFQVHRPEVKAKEGKAYADGVDLFAVIEGRYTTEGISYTYLYDFDADIMYTTEAYLAVVREVRKAAAHSLGVPEAALSIGFYRDLITAKSLNDRETEERLEEYAFAYSGVLPDGIDSVAFAAATLRGETELHAYASMIADTVPTPSASFFTDCPELLPLTVLIPSQLDTFGTYACELDADGVQENTLCLRQVREGLVGGYAMNGVSNEEAVITDNGEEIEFKFPEGAVLVLLWEGKGQPYVILTASNGTEKRIAIDACYCADCGIPGYKKISNYAAYDDIVLPIGDAVAYIYKGDSRTTDGIFRVVIQDK